VSASASAEPKRRGVSERLRAFGASCYEFVIGDDWVVAAGVVVGLLGTWGLHAAGVAAWWLLPLVLVVLLPISLERAVKGRLFRWPSAPLPPRRRRGRRTPPASPHTPPGS
jgi:hypothetical protein